MTVSEAAASGDVEQLRILLDSGGDPNEPETEENWPPLLEAASNDQEEAARLLLEAGADMYAPNNGGETSLQKAVSRGSLGVFRLLIECGYQMNAERDNAAWMLTHLPPNGHLEIVRWLLAQGVDVDVTDFRGCTALTRAAHNDQLEIVEELLRAGADPNHRDNDTETVLMYAADHPGNAAVLRALIQAGAEVNARSNEEGTALSWSVSIVGRGDPEMVQVLLEAGADVDALGVLTRAAYYGFAPAVRQLLKFGANIHVTDEALQGQTALALARSRGHREVVNLLIQAEADQQLRETGRTYPPPRCPVGTHVQTLTGTPREGWIVLVEWHHKRGAYCYHIEVEGHTQPRKNVSGRYWEEDLEVIEDEHVFSQ